jgi:hypothetical protein
MSTNPNVPVWLQDSDDDALKYVESAASPPTSTTIPSETDAPPSPNVDRSGRSCCRYTHYIISIIFFALFVASAVFKKGDSGGISIVWTIFYVMHAVTVGACLIFLSCCKVPCVKKPLVMLVSSMTVWSITMVVFSALEVSKTLSGGPANGGGNQNWTNKQEKAYQLGGAVLGLVSALYYILLCWLSGKGDNKE